MSIRDNLFIQNPDLAMLVDVLEYRFAPIVQTSIFNTALPTADTNLLASDLTPNLSRGYLRIYACISVSGILKLRRTRGATTVTELLNAGSALTASAAYMFDIHWRSGDSINLQYSVTTGTIYVLAIDEFGGGV